MNVYAIVVRGNEISEQGFETLQASSQAVGNEFEIKRYDAVTPENAPALLKESGLEWTYPWHGVKLGPKIRLKLSAYPTRNRWARVACALSHYDLWDMCAEQNDPIMILEHDAKFIRKIDPDQVIKDSKANVLAINSPLGATRKAKVYHHMVSGSASEYPNAPWIDTLDVPQGLPGNSAYILQRKGAVELRAAVKQLGLWPNDAIMCNQIISRLKVCRTYYTQVQGLRSTTTE